MAAIYFFVSHISHTLHHHLLCVKGFFEDKVFLPFMIYNQQLAVKTDLQLVLLVHVVVLQRDTKK